MAIEQCTEEEKAVAARNFAIFSRTLQQAEFIGLLPEAQEATLEEAHSLLFGQCVPMTVKRQLLELLKALEMCPAVGTDNTHRIKQTLELWDTPRF